MPYFQLREDVSLTYFVTKEYDNGTCKSSHVVNGEKEDVINGRSIEKKMTQSPGLCLSFEVTNEMKINETCFSKSKLVSVYGINFVYNSHIPKKILIPGRKLEGLRKVKKVKNKFRLKAKLFHFSFKGIYKRIPDVWLPSLYQVRDARQCRMAITDTESQPLWVIVSILVYFPPQESERGSEINYRHTTAE